MYVNTVFCRKPGHRGIDAINTIQEDYRKWSCKYVKECDSITVAEISPDNHIVHVHNITYFGDTQKAIDYMTYATTYEAKPEASKCFYVKQSIIPSEKEVLAYYKYMHKTINKNNYLDKIFRNSKIFSKSILTRRTREYNKQMEELDILTNAAAALADARPKGGSIYINQYPLTTKTNPKYNMDMFLEME